MVKTVEELNIFRRYFNWRKAGCIFVHIPKAAGTSINHSLYGRTLGHYSASTIKNRFPKLYESAFTFSVTRNPWDRLLSAYRFACSGGTGEMGIKKPSQYHIKEFESFERFVLEWFCYQNPYDLDYVFQPQHKFVFGPDEELLVDWLGCIENIDVTLSKVKERTGRPVTLEVKNSTGDQSRYEDFYTSQRMVDIVAEQYRKDLELLNYSFGA